MKLPYGFDPRFRHIDNDGWVNLATINEFLEDQEAIPPDLAQWLGLAIRHSDGNPDEFLKRLGLKKRRGRQTHKHAGNAWLEWGGRVCRREDNGEGAEKALAAVLEEYGIEVGEEVSRSQLQAWRDTYRKADLEARCR